MVSFSVLRQVVCATAGRVGTERGHQGDSSQQPTERCAYPNLTALGLPLAGLAGNSGCTDFHTNSCTYWTRQVKWCECTQLKICMLIFNDPCSLRPSNRKLKPICCLETDPVCEHVIYSAVGNVDGALNLKLMRVTAPWMTAQHLLPASQSLC